MSDQAGVGALLIGMATAWERADGASFAAAFTEDADFVNILGGAFSGRQAIAAQHQFIFDTIYKGSHARFELTRFRKISPDVAVAQISAMLNAPGGPRPGVTNTLASATLTKSDGGWAIASFHNTVVVPVPPAPG
jgi:uncharacterized protein (TIGR02246 family)